MTESDSSDPSKRKSFFEDDMSNEEESEHQFTHRLNPARERMVSRYQEEEDDEEESYNEEEFDRRGSSIFSSLGSLSERFGPTKQLVYAAAGIGGILIIFVGGWLVFHSRQNGIPVFASAEIVAKQKPANPGGMQAIGMGTVASEETEGSVSVAPGPEKANLNGLKEQYAQPAPENVGQALSGSVSGANVPSDQNKGSKATAQSAITAQQNPVESLPPSTSSNPSNPTAVDNNTKESTDSASTNSETQNPSAVESKELETQHLSHARSVKERPATEKVLRGKYELQLAALGSEEAARQEWQELRRRAPTLLPHKPISIQRAEVQGKMVYRLRIKGFQSKVQALTFCNQLKEKRVSCTLANF